MDKPKISISFSPLRSWFRAIYGHIGFLIVLGFVLFLGALPAVGSIALFFASGSFVFFALFFPAAGLFGILWTAANRTAWDLQFGHAVYLYQTFGKYLKSNAKQGFVLGILFGTLWLVVLSPHLLALSGALELTTQVTGGSVCLAVVLSILSSYSFYQAGRWQLSTLQLLKNSLLLLFSTGLPALMTAFIWVAFLAGCFLMPLYILPLCCIASLPMVVCITAQSFHCPKIDAIMSAATTQ